MVVIVDVKLEGNAEKHKMLPFCSQTKCTFYFLSFCNWLRAWWDIEQL